MITLDWWWLLVLFALGAVGGGLAVRFAGPKWLAVIGYILKSQNGDIAALAVLAWNTPGLIPDSWKKARWGNSEDKFVRWVKTEIEKLGDVLIKLEAVDRALNT